MIREQSTINTNEYKEQIKNIKMRIGSINYITESSKEKIKIMLDDMSAHLIKYTEDLEVPDFMGGIK